MVSNKVKNNYQLHV